MKKHVMAITYTPKIEPVRDGRCTQTIRKGRRFSVGDSVLIHGWAGRPYRSKWSWRVRVTVNEVLPIQIYKGGIGIVGIGVLSWDDWWVNKVAKRDFIEPATGEELKKVLFGLNGAPTEAESYQIIRW